GRYSATCFSNSFRLSTWAGHNIVSLSASITPAGSSNEYFDMTSDRQPSGTRPASAVALQPVHPHNTPAISLGLSNSPRGGFFFIPAAPHLHAEGAGLRSPNSSVQQRTYSELAEGRLREHPRR